MELRDLERDWDREGMSPTPPPTPSIISVLGVPHPPTQNKSQFSFQNNSSKNSKIKKCNGDKLTSAPKHIGQRLPNITAKDV